MNTSTQLTHDQLRTIIGNDWDTYKLIFDNGLCFSCGNDHHATIVNYEIYLNNLNDILLKGQYKKCGNPLTRYTETGENPEYLTEIDKIRKHITKIPA